MMGMGQDHPTWDDFARGFVPLGSNAIERKSARAFRSV